MGSITYTFTSTTFTVNNIANCTTDYLFSFYDSNYQFFDTLIRHFQNYDTCINLFASNSALSCNGACDATATAVAASGTAPYSYTWMPQGLISAVVNSVCAGVYTIIAEDATGKFGMTELIIFNPSNSCVGIKEYYLYNRISLFPNPVSTTLFISAESYFEKRSEIEISNSFGQIVLKLNYSNEIDISSLSSGYYTLKIISLDKPQLRSKFIKE
jgi:hypothetical protein